MAKIILHPPGTTREEIEEQRLIRNLERTPNERMKLMFALNLMVLRLKGRPLKERQGKGIILYRRNSLK